MEEYFLLLTSVACWSLSYVIGPFPLMVSNLLRNIQCIASKICINANVSECNDVASTFEKNLKKFHFYLWRLSHPVKVCNFSIDLAASFLSLTAYLGHRDCLTFSVDILRAWLLAPLRLNKIVGRSVDTVSAITNTSVSRV